MAKLIVFPARRVRRLARRVLWTASRVRLTRPVTRWADRPVPSEPLGNMLQRLAVVHPYAVLVIENLVAELLRQIDALK